MVKNYSSKKNIISRIIILMNCLDYYTDFSIKYATLK